MRPSAGTGRPGRQRRARRGADGRGTAAAGRPHRQSLPADRCRSATRPAYGEGSSTGAFAVSTSHSGWSTPTTSPTSTTQASTSPSGEVPRRVGEAEGPARHRHTLAVASERSTASSTRSRSGRNALQTRRRVGHVVTGHAQDRGLERVERVLLQLGRDLRPHAESAARLVHDNAATGATHGVEHGRHVQGRQRPQVHDLQVAPSVSATAAASRQVRTVGPCATSVRSLPGRTTRAACRGSGA